MNSPMARAVFPSNVVLSDFLGRQAGWCWVRSTSSARRKIAMSSRLAPMKDPDWHRDVIMVQSSHHQNVSGRFWTLGERWSWQFCTLLSCHVLPVWPANSAVWIFIKCKEKANIQWIISDNIILFYTELWYRTLDWSKPLDLWHSVQFSFFHFLYNPWRHSELQW